MLVLGETVAGQSDRQLTGSSKIAVPEVVRTVMQSEAQGEAGRGWKLSETSTLQILPTMYCMVSRASTGRDHTVLIHSCCIRANSVCSEQTPTVRVGSENCKVDLCFMIMQFNYVQ